MDKPTQRIACVTTDEPFGQVQTGACVGGVERNGFISDIEQSLWIFSDRGEFRLLLLEHFIKYMHNLIGADTFHAGMVSGTAFFPVQRTGPTGKVHFQYPISFPCRGKTPDSRSGTKQGNNRCSNSGGKVHGAGISGNQYGRLVKQRAGFPQSSSVGEIVFRRDS